MSIVSSRSVYALASFLLLLVASCGYTAGMRLKDSGVTSLGVEFFGNETLERDLERDFDTEITRALRDFGDVPLDHVEDAQTFLRGTIRQYHRRSGIRSPENKLLETGVYFEVEATLWQRGDKKPLRGPARASSWFGYVLEPTGENERLARQSAMHHVAEELVLDLLAPVN